MRKVLLVGILLMETFILSAQSDFRSGYLLLSGQDTVKGLINYKGDINSSKKCFYRASESSEIITYTPDQLLGYRFQDGKYYVAKSLTLEGQSELLFLEYLVNGLVDFYYYKDIKGDHYLVEDEEGTIRELKNTEKLLKKDGLEYSVEGKEYVGVLNTVFAEYPELSNKTSGAALGHRSLINLAIDYHNQVCTTGEACLVYEKKESGKQFSFSAVAGWQLAYLNIVNKDIEGDYYFLDEADFNTSSSPLAGAMVALHLNRISEKLTLNYQITFSKIHFQMEKYQKNFLNVERLNKVELDQILLNNQLTLQYDFTLKKTTPYIGGGTYLRNAITSDYSRSYQEKYSYTDWSNKEMNDQIKRIYYGYTILAGVKTELKNGREIRVFGCFENGSGIIPKDTSTGITTWSFGVNYQLK